MKVIFRLRAQILIFILFALLFHRFFSARFIYGDGFIFHEPLKRLVARGLCAGEIYGWNPWQFLGLPFAGDVMAGWFYPLNVAFLIFPFEAAYRIFVLIHYPLAALFMAMFMKGRGLGRRAGWFSGLAYALSGYLLSQHSNPTFLIGPAWAPLALAGFDRALAGRTSGAIGAGAVMAVQVLAGDAQSALVTGALIGAWGLAAALRNRKRSEAALSKVLVAAATGVLFSAVQWFPTLELYSRSLRSRGLPLSEAVKFSFHPWQLLELVWPTPFGRLWPGFDYWARFALDESSNPWSITNYLGVPALTLAGLGLVLSKRRWKLGIGAAMIFFLLLALGRYTPLFDALYRYLPMFSSFRFPAKYLAWFCLFAAMAAGLGWEAIEERLSSDARGLVRPAIVYIAVWFLLVAVSALWWPRFMEHEGGLAPGSRMFAEAASHLVRGGAQILMVTALTGLIVILIGRRRLPVKTGAYLLLAALVVDWWLASVAIMPGSRQKILETPSVSAKTISLKGDSLGRFRIFRRPMEFKLNRVKPGSTMLESLGQWAWDSLNSNLDNCAGIENLVGYNAIRMAQGNELLENKLTPQLLELYNAAFIISSLEHPQLMTVNRETKMIDYGRDLRIDFLPEAMPRAYWVPAALAVPDESAALSVFDQVDFRKTVILTAPETSITVTTDPGYRFDAASVEITGYAPDRVTIAARAPAPGWLVLSDRAYPGWQARLDGQPVRIEKANIMVRAIRFPEGAHEVVFRYRPETLRIGTAVTMAALIAMIGLALFNTGRGSRKKRALDPDAP